MENIVEIKYAQTNASTNTNEMGMREMQSKVYEARAQQYLLIKAPPASGKSRALMFLALDKLRNQGVKRVIVAVPEKTIGRSFQNTDLKKFGFFDDWKVARAFNLCDSEDERDKGKRFREFFTQTTCNTLVCTHSTLRFAMKDITDEQLNDCLIAIDEFHHTSADVESGLGEIVRRLIANSSAHIIAMTGSYFRGDGVPVLRAEDEMRFHSVTYNYYQQLNGYRYLKSLGLGYHFYQGNYLTAIQEVLDTTKKTIIHIPSVRSRASAAMDKADQVDQIMKLCGEIVSKDYDNCITTVKTPDGRLLKFADLVEDTAKERTALQSFLQRMNKKEDVDIIIALGTAKEGFDWEWCEHCLTVGVRGSLTEIIQIIGRCTRDCVGKAHAQFTNLIAAPTVEQDKVTGAVNDMIKAITASLLMEQVMAPSWNFKTHKEAEEDNSGIEDKRTLIIEGLKPFSSSRSQQIVDQDLNYLKATVLQSPLIAKALMGETSPEAINTIMIPKIIRETYPDLNEDETEEVRQRLVLDMVVKGNTESENNGEEARPDGDRMIRLVNRLINIKDLSISLIDSINPFQRAYQIMSKSVTAPVLKVIQDTIAERKMDMTVDEAVILYKGPLKKYIEDHNGKLPSINDGNPKVRRLAHAIIVLRNLKLRQKMGLEYDPNANYTK